MEENKLENEITEESAVSEADAPDLSENTEATAPEADTTAEPSTENAPKQKKSKLSGAYWFSEKSGEELSKQSFIRTMLTIIAFLLQLVVLVLPQGGIEYITKNLPQYALVYVFTVFVMIFIAVFVFVMNFFRYRLMKRIPKEYAPRGGFKRRSYFGAEAFVVITFIIFVMEISFVCLNYDGFGLLGVFVAALSVAAAVWARMVTVLTLKDAIYVPAIGEEVPPESKTEEK